MSIARIYNQTTSSWETVDSILKQSTAPTSPLLDDLWIDTSSTPNILKRYDGAQWIEVSHSTDYVHITDQAYLNIKNGNYVVVGDGIEVTPEANQEIVSVKPATSSTLGGLKVGTGLTATSDGTTTIDETTNHNWTGSHTFAKIKNVATKGSFGVPVVVADTSEMQLTTTNLTNVVSFTPTMNGNFLAFIYVRVANAPTTVNINVVWTSAGGNQSENVLPATSLSIGDFKPPFPIYINATTGGQIQIQVSSGTLNNVYCSATIIGI